MKLQKVIFLLSFWLFANALFAQNRPYSPAIFDTLRTMRGKESINTAIFLFHKHITHTYSSLDTILLSIKRMESAAHNPDPVFRDLCEGLAVVSYIIFDHKYIDPYNKLLVKKVGDLEAKQEMVLAAYFKMSLAQVQMGKGNQKEALGIWLEVEKAYKRVNFKDCPLPERLYVGLADVFYKLLQYQKALAYFKQAEPFLNTNIPYLQIEYYNKLNVVYSVLKDTENASLAGKRAYEIAEQAKDSIWIGLTAGNYGVQLYRAGRILESKPYFECDYHASLRAKQYWSAGSALLHLAIIEAKTGDKALALQKMSESDRLCYQTPGVQYTASMWITTNKMYAELSEALKDYSTALYYQKRVQLATDSLNMTMRAKQDTVLKVLYSDLDKTKIENLEQQRHLGVLRLYMLATLLIGLVVAIWQVGKRYLQKQAIIETKLHDKQAELTTEKAKRRALEVELKRVLQSITERNIEKQRYKQVETDQQEVQSQELQATILRNISIHTQTDWQLFQVIFDKAYPDFFQTPAIVQAALSKAETRLIALMHLGMSSKDIADALAISPESLRKARYRMRKKLGDTGDI